MCPIAPKQECARTSFAALAASDFDGAMNAMLRPNTPELSSLLPREVATVVVAPRHRDVPVLAAEAEYLAAHAMHPRREAEFRAGRACAREALSRIGIDGWPLIPATTREPQWPDDVVGSITHSGAYCAAAVARGHHCAGIGIDVEATGRVGDELAPAVCSRDELAALDKHGSSGRAELLTLIFSAKESVFKAIFPRQRLFLEFSDVEIEFEPENGTFRALGRAPELERLLTRLEGRFAIGKVNLATTAVLTH
jgi:4'-phosphopantetheinyl transferase EntD